MNISAVVQRFDTGPTEELAPTLTDALEDIERNLDELPRAVDAGHAEARRLACLEASPITDQERADLIAEETR